jgi:hypothetical protein
MKSPPNEKPPQGSKGLRKLTKQRVYHALNLVQAPFGFVFWLIEQLKARLQEQVENATSES